MKKNIFITVLFLIVSACSDDSNRLATIETRINELELKIRDSYKPGFGEFMSNIQVHHAKLWFAGVNNNWQLADFEINEIRETLEDLEKSHADRVEIKSLPMIFPVLDAVNTAVEKKDPQVFKKNYTILTETCNNCHHTVNYDFNIIKIPERPPFSNQIFAIKKK